MHCTNCGKQVPEGATFCGACGAPMSPTPPAQQPPPPPPGYAPPQPAAPAKSGTSCWLIGCVALLALTVVLGTIGYFGWRKYQARLTEVSEAIGQQLELDTGGQTTADENAVREVVEDFYDAWATGDTDAARSLSTASYATTLDADSFGTGYTQYSLTIVEAKMIDADHWQVVADEEFSNIEGGRNTERSTIDLVDVGGNWRINTWAIVVLEITTDGGGSQSNSTPGGQSSGSNSSGSASGESVASVPSPMPTLNAFLEDAGKGDGQAMARRMTPAARNEFGEVADMWGQGDWEHDSFEVNSQQKNSDTQWHFEVTETMRDWETNAPFYSTYGVDLQWSGQEWQISGFRM